MRKLVLIVSALLTIVSFQNCAEQSYNFAETDTNAGAGVVPATESKSQSFASQSTAKSIDMVWVIDNSVSMVQNVNRVKANFKAFVENLDSKIDIRVALISRSEASSINTQIALADYTSNGKQVHFMVHSYNPMLVAALSTCPASPDKSDVLCSTLKGNSRYAGAYGSLNSFFRSGSQKVFVFVSDDDSSNVSANTSIQYDSVSDPKSYDNIKVSSLTENVDYITPATFQARMTKAFGSATAVKSFGFLAYDKASSPCLARTSVNYQSLIKSSGGAHFNICNSDWSSAFSTLTTRVVDFAKNTYAVADDSFLGIDYVELNGSKLLADKDFTVSGNTVTLNSSLLSQVGNYSIVVHYVRGVVEK
ncbi:VWA domain-containing protein [Bdellovibrio sp. KM01]|uniref:VWA domain-containing protein n=1 Tax=Bdellovibrio sp. KM01 TaxID=2748865 RepID=UPI001C674180|nr:VWA domain-containing protein [Bdellovibrio sp. KM01]